MRKTKPTSPGRRFATYQQREDVTKSRPHKPLTKGKNSTGGRNSHGPRHRRATAAAAPSAATARSTSSAPNDGVPAKVATIEYDPNRTTYIALLHYADGRKSYILAPQGLGVGASGRVRRARGHPARQRAAAARDPDGNHRPQRRADPRPGRPPRPRRRHRDPGGREGGPDGHAAPALVRDADGPRRVPRDRRHALELRAPERDRSARPAATATRASARRPVASR